MHQLLPHRGILTEIKPGIVLLIIIILLLLCATVAKLHGQHASGSYSITTPEANLFALNPAALNPAAARGIIGMSGNPAALASITGSDFGFAVGFAHSEQGSFDIQILDAIPEFEAVTLHSKFTMEEKGGIALIGIGRRYKNFAVGFTITQPRRAGINFNAGGGATMRLHFDADEPITRETVPDLPVESIPMLWHVETATNLEIHSRPAEISISTLPLYWGAAYKWGRLSLGAGLKYLYITSNDGAASITANLSGSATITGTPYGLDQIFGIPWSGTVQAITQFKDQPFAANYKIGLQGSRWVLTTGVSLNLTFLKLGLVLEHGFKDKLDGAYQIQVRHTSGPPLGLQLSNVSLDLHQLPNVTGSATLELSEFQKDSVVFNGSGHIDLGGYTGISGGLQLWIFGLYVGAEMPASPPDFGAFYFAAYTDIPLYFMPVRLRAGFIQQMDFFFTEEEDVVPYRSAANLTIGTAIRFKVQRYLHYIKQPVELQVGVRSSLLPLAFSQVKEEFAGLNDNKLPNMLKTLTLGFGLQLFF